MAIQTFLLCLSIEERHCVTLLGFQAKPASVTPISQSPQDSPEQALYPFEFNRRLNEMTTSVKILWMQNFSVKCKSLLWGSVEGRIHETGKLGALIYSEQQGGMEPENDGSVADDLTGVSG